MRSVDAEIAVSCPKQEQRYSFVWWTILLLLGDKQHYSVKPNVPKKKIMWNQPSQATRPPSSSKRHWILCGWLLLLSSSIGECQAFSSTNNPLLPTSRHGRSVRQQQQQQRFAMPPNDTQPQQPPQPQENASVGVDRRTWSWQLLQKLAWTAAGSSSSTVWPLQPSLAATKNNQDSSFLLPTPPLTSDVYWPTGKVAFSLLPLTGPRRKTIQETIVDGMIWTHDQWQGIVNVNVPVRQVVVKLSNDKGLWVHNPVAPTPELVAMMHQLEEAHGPVRHVVLGTVALEHKATFGAFCRYFPQATVWIQPGQWSFPVTVPIEFYGLPQRGRRLRELPVPGRPVTAPQYAYYSNEPPEWLDDFDYQVLGPFSFQAVGAFSETAFYHKPTQSLIVTDVVCSLTDTPPAIVQEDARCLLYHARNTATDDLDLQDSLETRQRGWRRMALFGLVFFPSQIQVQTVSQALRDAQHVPPALQNLGQGAIPGTLYPWTWDNDSAEVASFNALAQNGRLFCPPILTKLILDREPEATLAWVDQVVQRFGSTKRILPSHLNNNVPLGKNGMDEFAAAFDPLRSRPNQVVPQRALAEDLKLLQEASDLLTQYGIVAPSQVCDGEPARVQGKFRFASN